MRRLAAALVVLPLLSACSGAEPPAVAAPAAGDVVVPAVEVGLGGAPVPVAPPPAEVPAGVPDEPVVEADPDDTAVPPGDPGVDAPAVPEPAGTQVHDHEEPRGRVPAAALLRAADLGPGWRAAQAEGGACAPAQEGPSASRSLASAAGGVLTETVTVPHDALEAVADWRAALRGCGYAVAPLVLGDDGVSAVRTGERVLVTTSEQVVVVLRATGALAADPALVDWADLALGSSCPAAPDGCH